MDAVATRYIDESLANAMQATAVNSIQEGDFKQVVLFGDGFDTRPFRLDWPAGTLLFVVAPAEVHEKAEALLAASPRKPHAPRGCLLRRVNMNLRAAATAAADAAEASPAGSSSSSSEEGGPEQQEQRQQQAVPTAFAEQLSRAGFRGDRLSVWALQGLHGQGLSQGVLQQLLAEIANCAAFHRWGGCWVGWVVSCGWGGVGIQPEPMCLTPRAYPLTTRTPLLLLLHVQSGRRGATGAVDAR